ncbi:MAG: hypothetical protein ACKO32_09975 [Planctomycetia bacterium]
MIVPAVFRWILVSSLAWPLLLLHLTLLATLIHASGIAPAWMEYVQGPLSLTQWLAWNQRADGWNFVLLIVGTGLCARAAWLIERWKRHDIDWLRTRSVAPLRLHSSVLLGLLCAAFIWLGISAAVIETLPAPQAAFEARARVAADDAIWVDGHEPARVRIAAQGPGDALSLALIATRGAPQVRMQANWLDAPEHAVLEVATRGRLLVPLPAEGTRRVLELRVEPGHAAALWSPMDSYVLERSKQSRLGAVRMLLHGWLLISMALCATLLCSLWMRAGIAIALVAALMLAIGTRLPLQDALDFLRLGWLPRWPDPMLIAMTLTGCLLTPVIAGWSWVRVRRQR